MESRLKKSRLRQRWSIANFGAFSMDDTEELVDINTEKYQADTLERSHCTNYPESVTSATNMAGRTDDENGPERIGPFSRTEL